MKKINAKSDRTEKCRRGRRLRKLLIFAGWGRCEIDELSSMEQRLFFCRFWQFIRLFSIGFCYDVLLYYVLWHDIMS